MSKDVRKRDVVNASNKYDTYSKEDTTKLSRDREVISGILFSFHIILIVLVIVLSFMVPLYALIIIVVLWQLHLNYFGGCIITLTQRKIDGLDPKYTFFQDYVYKVTGKHIGETGVNIISIIIAIVIFSISIITNIRRWKLNNKGNFKDLLYSLTK